MRIMKPLVLVAILAPGALSQSISETFLPPNPQANQGFGEALATGDFDQNGLDDLAIGSPAAAGGSGAVYVEYALPGGSSVRITIPAPAGVNEFGASLAAGDIDADGIDELVVGVPGSNGAGAIGGGVYTFDVVSGLLFSPKWNQVSFIPGERFGASVAITPDIALDGDAEVVVGAPGSIPAPFEPNSSGAVYLYSGTVGAVMGVTRPMFPYPATTSIFGFEPCATLPPNPAGFALKATANSFGIQVVGGDFDGRVEIVNGVEVRRGDVVVLYGHTPVICPFITASPSVQARLLGGQDASNGGYLSNSFSGGAPNPLPPMVTFSTQDLQDVDISSGGDIDGDGLEDLLTGQTNSASNAGSMAAYRFDNATSSGGVQTLGSFNLLHRVNGNSNGDVFGCAVTSLGDANMDGFSDAIGAGESDAPSTFAFAGGNGASTLGAPLGEASVFSGESPVEIVSLDRFGDGRRQVALAVRTDAGAEMVEIIRFDDPSSTLSSMGGEISAQFGGANPLFLDAGSQAGNEIALLLVGNTMDPPGFMLNDGSLILLAGNLANASPSTYFGNNLLTLDSAGRGIARLKVPGGLPQSLVGATIYVQYLTIGILPSGIPFTGNASTVIPFTFVP